jgi:hypothetical protein
MTANKCPICAAPIDGDHINPDQDFPAWFPLQIAKLQGGAVWQLAPADDVMVVLMILPELYRAPLPGYGCRLIDGKVYHWNREEWCRKIAGVVAGRIPHDAIQACFERLTTRWGFLVRDPKQNAWYNPEACKEGQRLLRITHAKRAGGSVGGTRKARRKPVEKPVENPEPLAPGPAPRPPSIPTRTPTGTPSGGGPGAPAKPLLIPRTCPDAASIPSGIPTSTPSRSGTKKPADSARYASPSPPLQPPSSKRDKHINRETAKEEKQVERGSTSRAHTGAKSNATPQQEHPPTGGAIEATPVAARVPWLDVLESARKYAPRTNPPKTMNGTGAGTIRGKILAVMDAHPEFCQLEAWAQYWRLVAQSEYLTKRARNEDGRLFRGYFSWFVDPRNVASVLAGQWHDLSLTRPEAFDMLQFLAGE